MQLLIVATVLAMPMMQCIYSAEKKLTLEQVNLDDDFPYPSFLDHTSSVKGSAEYELPFIPTETISLWQKSKDFFHGVDRKAIVQQIEKAKAQLKIYGDQLSRIRGDVGLKQHLLEELNKRQKKSVCEITEFDFGGIVRKADILDINVDEEQKKYQEILSETYKTWHAARQLYYKLS